MTDPTAPAAAESHTASPVSSPARRSVISVLLVAVLAFLALLGWAFASPVGASPDDNFHLTSIWCAQGERAGFCETGASSDQRAVPAEVAWSSACYATKPDHSGRCDLPLTGMVNTGHGNFEGLYPPVYYATMSVFVSSDVQTSVLLMRVFNALLAVSLITAVYLLVDHRLRRPLLWGLLLTSIPTGIFLISSVNPSGWAIVSATTLWVSLVGFFRAPTLARRIGLGGLALTSAMMGAGSRGDSAVFVAFGAVLAAVIAFERSRRYLLLLILPLATVVIGAAFYLGSNQVGSALDGEMAGQRPTNVHFVADMLRTLLNIPKLWVGNFGTQALGWGDVALPAVVWFITLALYAGVAFWGLSRTHKLNISIATLLAGIALVMVPSLIIVQNGVEVGVLVQPRYILPLQILFLAMILLDNSHAPLALTGLQRGVIIVGLSAANGIALYKTFRRFLTGTGYPGIDLDQNVQWWWRGLAISPDVFWIAGTLAFAALLFFASRGLARHSAPDALPH
ncbi:Predicted membrane protein [Microbacterium azadirachtae]|uniref:Predicted membrane protein n=1 Tax=Microbacterium azadirachtae TaxID=582680 RepID=A0A1I6GJB6_9MICO|nr:DUF2142 domain-containing protein [Microbacterium azadirachtae]SFR42260.1 Predicted membrane protein [Microbacterium azadirachtae]